MEIRDIIHGAIEVADHELPLIDSRYFQRLRQIKQLGFSEYSFPSASHNRYNHSLGAMATATRAFREIFKGVPQAQKYLSVARWAALLHDIGHGPLSHTTEFAMPPREELKLPVSFPSDSKKATHEDYTLKIILDSSLTPLLEQAGRAFGVKPLHVACLIEPRIPCSDGFFVSEGLDYRPILQQLISSELDADRMDYLRRDSAMAGVSYGHFDFDWLASNLTYHAHEGRCYLALHHRALYTFEDFLISRFHMFLMVYFHYKGVILDEMLAEYFRSPDCDYHLPADIEEYADCNDSHLFSHLAKSANPWANRITRQKPYRMLVEVHSGIPAEPSAQTQQLKLLEEIETLLKQRKTHYIKAKSTSELSKYFMKPGDPIFVRYDNYYSTPSFIPLEKCTDLFRRYREERSVTRIYVDSKDLETLKLKK